MRKILTSPLLRVLICFLLICCMFISYAAIPARAFGYAEVVIPALALVYMYLVLQTGFIPPPDITISNLENIDKSLRNWYGDFDISFRNPDDPWPDDLDDEESDLAKQLDAIKDAVNNGAEDDLDQTLKLSEGLLNFFKAMIAFCFTKDAIPLPGVEAPEGYAYYNGVCLPVFSNDSFTSFLLLENKGSSSYTMLCNNTASYSLRTYSDGSQYYSGEMVNRYDLIDGAWESQGKGQITPYDSANWPYVWSNRDVLDYHNSSIVVWPACSGPLTQEEAYLEAAAILGETAQGIQDGTKTEDDIVIPQYVNVSELFANAASADDLMQNYNQIAQELQDGTRDYNEFAQSVVASAPSTDDSTGSDTGVEDGTGTGTDTGDTWEPPSDPGKFALDLSNYFPFCIPFDLYDFLACLNADPVTPVIQWELALPGGGSYPLEIDLSPFDSVAQLLRRLQLLLFAVGLAFKTRDLIKG